MPAEQGRPADGPSDQRGGPPVSGGPPRGEAPRGEAPRGEAPRDDTAREEAGAQARAVYAAAVRRAGNPRGGREFAVPDGTSARVRDWLAEHRLIGADGTALSSPERALRTLLGDQERQLRSAVALLEQNIHALDDVVGLLALNRLGGREAVHVEFFEDRGRLRKRLEDVDALSREEYLAMRSSFPEPEVLDASLGADLEMLGRGVDLRMLVSAGAVRRPGAARYLGTLAEAGAEVRVTASLPLYLSVVDRSLTVMSLEGDAHGSGGDVILHSHLVATCFTRVFEHNWAAARPYPVRAGPADADGEYSPQEREVLTLLATGAKDESIARRLGCSERTLRRMLTQLMEKLGAESRFEAGVRAAGLGLVD
ncbi:LuxR family transcriptional regulator [Streptomyces sp. SCUT-3]|uniref:helix-turn-helix transcriptional regulator n=1 Tax=Streptomyces sp. SCUT-3 TaxID=2684469 RepID=UPI000CAAF6E9|nr:LuxR C-terminal-related transcriptional regulator [Streptomyces sp. SCUT-3]PLW69545.1 LuxR family transcriptional regulator [Streptomyces sp. DJ]QMV23952.1 LuxR family transcriptional regulator [Streptomyces sp. SCUT-3]